MDKAALEQLFKEHTRLCQRVEEYEKRYASVVRLDNIVEMLYSHYTKQTNVARTPLTSKFYAHSDVGVVVALPDDVEYLIETLWLGRVDTCSIDFEGVPATLKLHAKRLQDDLPLPILECPDGNTTKTIPILRRLERHQHTFMIKHDPALNGVIISNANAKQWAADSFIATSAEVSVFPRHRLLSQMIDLWVCRKRSEPYATLVVDAAQFRSFVHKLAENDEARCHFTCTGQTQLHAYLCLSSGDGWHTDLYRLFIGTGES